MPLRKAGTAATRPGGSGLTLRPSYATGLVVATVLAAAACGGSRPAMTLADGSTGERIPSPLSSLGDSALLTTERTLPLRSLDARGRACVTLAAERQLAPAQPFVERVDHYGSSVTFRPRGGPYVIGCTSAADSSGAKRIWCGHIVGEIRGGHLLDPRLDIACRTATGAAIGSAWIEPVADARWIVVRARELIQIYPVSVGTETASLPIRVTTLAADIPTATAVFRVEQYDAEGTRVSEATLRTAVAG
jgi:hypothetical protein